MLAPDHDSLGGLMGARGSVRGVVRRSVVVVALVALAIPALAATMAQAKVVPPVPAAGVGTKAALESEQCGDDGKLAYPYPQRLPCTAPLKQGQSNGGATSMGVTKDKIKIVLFLGTHAQQDADRSRPGSSAPIDLATNQPAYFEDSFPPWQEVLGHNFNSWGRELDFVTVNPSGTDEAAQRADALRVAEEEPFAVFVNVPVTAGGGQVFASELVAKKIIVFFGGVTNEEAGQQAPYRYLGGFDNNAAAINTAAFAARQLQGETAKWSGDYVDEKRVFGTVYPDTGIDWEFFESTAKKEKLKVATNVVYTVPLDSSQTTPKAQEEAPTIAAKLKDAGVTTVLLFTSFQLNQALLKSAEDLDYHPEWVFSGMGAQDIEITARILNGIAPEQMKHLFGLGNLPLYVAAINDPQRGLVRLVLGWQPRRVLLGELRHAAPVQRRDEPRRAQADARDVPAGHVRHAVARRGGEQAAAELHDRARSDAEPSLRRVLPGRPRLRHHVVEPHGPGQGQDHLRRGRRPFPLHRRRQALHGQHQGRRLEAHRAQAVRHVELDRGVRRAARL